MSHGLFHSLIAGHPPQLVQIIGHHHHLPEKFFFLFTQTGVDGPSDSQLPDISGKSHPGRCGVFPEKSILFFCEIDANPPILSQVVRLGPPLFSDFVHRA
jgi:hypothetical protein